MGSNLTPSANRGRSTTVVRRFVVPFIRVQFPALTPTGEAMALWLTVLLLWVIFWLGFLAGGWWWMRWQL